MIKKLALGLVLATVTLLPLASAQAQTTYSDNAGNPTYSAASNYNGLNGGTGFGAFSVSAVNPNPPFAGTFLGDASTSENGGGTPAPGTLDSSNGKAFGFYANNGGAAQVTINRAFSNTLTKAGDSFSLDFLTGFNNDGTVGVALTNSSGQLAALNYAGGTGQFTFNGGSNSIAGYSSGVLHLTYTLTSATSVQLQVTGAVNTTQTATLSGGVTGFRVYQTNSVTDTANNNSNYFNGYVNNLSYTIASSAMPEPGDMALFAMGVGVLAVAARRRFAKP